MGQEEGRGERREGEGLGLVVAHALLEPNARDAGEERADEPHAARVRGDVGRDAGEENESAINLKHVRLSRLSVCLSVSLTWRNPRG